MLVRAPRTRLTRFAPLLLIGLMNCADCTEIWPPPDASSVKYLTVVPHELQIYVEDPKRAEHANLVAFVQGKFGVNLDDRTTRFSISSGGNLLSLAPLGAHPDTVTLTVAAACSTADQSCAPSELNAEVTATHDGSGLTLTIPVRVRYEQSGDHGVAAAHGSAHWPMFGLATGSVGGAWQGWHRRAFVRRAGIMKFDASDITIPVVEPPAGIVLSGQYAAWRKTNPWTTAPSDVTVPATAEAARAQVPVRAYYAGDPAGFAAHSSDFLMALQAAANIVSYTPIGALVTIQGAVRLVSPLSWNVDCADFGAQIKDSNPPVDPPDPSVISVYMLPFSATTSSGPRAYHCGPGTLQTTGPMSEARAIVVPPGSALAASLAHEFGHAFNLHHVTMGSGFFDDNLMVMTDDISAVLRSRLSLGQAFRAALHPKSFIVTSGQSKSDPLDCQWPSKACPSIVLDARLRTP